VSFVVSYFHQFISLIVFLGASNKSRGFCNFGKLPLSKLQNLLDLLRSPPNFQSGEKNLLSRRQLLKYGLLAGIGLAVPYKVLTGISSVFAFSQSDNLKKFIQPLRKIGTDIPIAQPDTANPGWWQPGVTHYTIDVGQFEDQLHPDLPNPTRLYGFGQGYSALNSSWTTHLGGVIAVKRGTPVQITFRNHLPANHIMPVDTTIMGGDQARDRACIHLHGGLVPWNSDGGPHAWWDPRGNHGPSFVNPLNPALAANEAEYYYPNDQGSRLLWYHDHTFGNTRINAYAGMATGYVIYDDYELNLVNTNHLPGPLDPRTQYLIFQDKIFVSSKTSLDDPTWFQTVHNSRIGDLWYDHLYNITDLAPGANPALLPNPSCVPEFFGDTILVNGSVYPFLEVEPRQYRFRILNACNARFLNPRLVKAAPDNASEPNLPEPTTPDPTVPIFTQIATEGGFLPAAVTLDGTPSSRLLLAPAERADLIVDFRNVPAGTTFILYNDAEAPYPMGDWASDYYPDNPNYGTPENPDPNPSKVGMGPNTRTLMQIRVVAQRGADDPEIALPATFTPSDPFLVPQTPGVPTPIPEGVKVRRLTLNETADNLGRLLQMLGTDQEPIAGMGFGRGYDMDPTEVVKAGTTEVWEIINLSADTHPMHFHLVNVQVLARLPFDPATYTGGAPTLGAAIAPDDNELGWKETVRVPPNTVVRVLMQFTLPGVPFKVPPSPRTGGHEYVWHCHILEHEEHDMMRPLIVQDHTTYLPYVANLGT
jgi:spore coat protein A